jgi:hypothetical protein
MKKEVSPALLISVIAAVVVVLGFITWRVFFPPSGSDITAASAKARKDKKEGD